MKPHLQRIYKIGLSLAALLVQVRLWAQQPAQPSLPSVIDTGQAPLQPLQPFQIVQNYDNYWEKFLNWIVTYVPRLIIGGLILYFGLKLVVHAIKVMNRVMKRNDFNEDLRPFLSTSISVTLKILLLLIVAEIVGLETTSFVAVLASIGFAVGLALQGSLSNFASGILILVFKPFRTGDMIRVQDYIGIVHEIQIFNTILKTIHDRLIVIPNSILTSDIVENITGAGIIRIEMIFGIGYADDIDDARDAIWGVIKGCPFLTVEKGKEHQVLVKTLNSSSVDLAAWVWAKGEDYWDALYFMQEYVKKAFDKKGITIPFPQVSMHLESSIEVPFKAKKN